MATRTTTKTTRPTPNANKVKVNANKVKVNTNKVDINAAKVRANAEKVAANAAKVKANAKATVVAPAKITKPAASTPKLTSAQMDGIPFKNNAIAKFQGTPGSSYVITAPDNQRSPGFGTEAQADSAYAEKYKWNDTYRNAEGELRGRPTKQGYQIGPSGFGKMTKAQIAALPDWVPPKSTGAGPLKRTSDVSKSTGYGKCEPGYVLRNGRCVPK